MIVRDVWASDTNFLELGAKDGELAAALVSQGLRRVLKVVRDEEARREVEARHPSLQRRVVASTSRGIVRRNNADVLILSGAAVLGLARRRNWRHVRQVAWVSGWAPWVLVAATLSLVYVLLRQLRWAGVVDVAGARGNLVLLEVRRRKPSNQPRRYVPHGLGVAGFLARLQEEQVRYAVLRWFESLPEVPEGEDIDLLVDDDDLEKVVAMLVEGPGIQPVDVYTVTGLPGSDYAGMPYFPPQLAEELLANTELHGGICRVPSPRHHFLSMAYHAVYHKGPRSGLGSKIARAVRKPEHDYGEILGKMAQRLGMQVELTLEGLERCLGENAWRPPTDMLVRLAGHHAWLRSVVPQDEGGLSEDLGLGVFVVRREGVRDNRLATILSLLEHQGFQILATRLLSERESRYAASCIRGGNWGRGPWKTSGGPPAAAIVTYDPEPIKPTARQRKEFPRLSNARLLVKKKIRDALNRDLPESQRSNTLHSSDNGCEALDYLRILMPDEAQRIQEQVQAVWARYATPEPVLRTITRHGRRAKIELIEFEGRPAVKKTFKPHQEHYCRNEAESLQCLFEKVPEVPTVLRADQHSVILPYYDDVLKYRRSSGKLFPLKTAKQAIDALERIYESGYALIDAHVENVLVDRNAGLKLIDFEFCHRYDQRPPTFQQSYDIAGCPSDFSGNLPDGGGSSYAKGWQPYVGLSLESLLEDPEWLQHAKRLVFWLAHLPRFLPRRLRGLYRGLREIARLRPQTHGRQSNGNVPACPCDRGDARDRQSPVPSAAGQREAA